MTPSEVTTILRQFNAELTGSPSFSGESVLDAGLGLAAQED